ncbi:universal stress protein A-like protein-like protein [Carex littledalei]|uniref:Universal stress protein A-like protein-like protein n=1 Tax=Carex littledalei TaxID=544730 RepID=A0A833QVX7_9POAL|nr:universal stress protein A-like protein-like protein [Carex littledalei]
MAGEAIARRVGVAMDFSACSRKALQWAADNLARTGDHLIVVTAFKPLNYDEGSEIMLWESSGSPYIPLTEISEPVTLKKYGVKIDAETIDMLNTIARQKEVVVSMKVLYGDPREKICEAVDSIPLSCLVIGNRGLGKIKRVFMGSVSEYVVNNASCPVTVVKIGEQEG